MSHTINDSQGSFDEIRPDQPAAAATNSKSKDQPQDTFYIFW